MWFNPISRRQFLRGLGGFTLSIPLLPSLLPKAYAATPPIRFVALVSYNGQFPGAYFPSVDANIKVTDQLYYRKLSEISGPISRVIGTEFDSLRSKISLIRGLGIPGSTGHNRCVPLTCSNHSVLGDQGAPVMSSSPRYPHSIDAILENSSSVYPTQPRLRALRLCPDDIEKRASSFSYRNGTKLPSIATAPAAFSTVFPGAQPGSSTIEASPDIGRQVRAIDLVKEDYKSLIQSRKISSADKNNFQNYVDLVNDVQRSLEVQAQPLSCGAPGQRSLDGTMDTVYRNHLDILAAALACGITNVGAVTMLHWRKEYRPTINPHEFHSNSHLDTSSDAEDRSAGWNNWIGKQVAYLMNRLDSFTEGEGTLLDNSIVLWTNELGNNGRAHKYGNIPLLIGGSGGGKLKTGHYIDYRWRPFVQFPQNFYQAGGYYHHLMNTFLDIYGVPHSEYEIGGAQGFGEYTMVGYKWMKDAYAKLPGGPRSTLPFYYLG